MVKVELTNVDVVLYVLFKKFGGHKTKVHTEEIAYESYRLAKDRFGWRLQKFRAKDFPDKELVRGALLNASRSPDGPLVEGRAGVEASGKETDGWIFTPLGVAWIRSNEERIARALGVTRSNTTNTTKKEADRFIKQMKSQPLFQTFIRLGSVDQENRYKFTDMLNTSPDASKEIITLKLNRLRAMAVFVGDSDIKRFLDACAKAFPNLLENSATEDSEGDR